MIFTSLPPVKSAGKVISAASLLLFPSIFLLSHCVTVWGLSEEPAANSYTSLIYHLHLLHTPDAHRPTTRTDFDVEIGIKKRCDSDLVTSSDLEGFAEGLWT